MNEPMPSLPELSPVNGKTLTARFDGGSLSSDAGLLALREVEQRLGVADRLAACIDDPRDPSRTQHSVTAILRFRMLVIAAGYEDGIDANALRADPMLKMSPGALARRARSLLAVHDQSAREPARPAHVAAHGADVRSRLVTGHTAYGLLHGYGHAALATEFLNSLGAADKLWMRENIS